MKKSEMIEVLARSTGLTKANVEEVFNGTFELFKSELGKGNNVTVAGFGTFKVAERAARDGINPLTKQPLHIPAKKAVSFKASTALKAELAKEKQTVEEMLEEIDKKINQLEEGK